MVVSRRPRVLVGWIRSLGPDALGRPGRDMISCALRHTSPFCPKDNRLWSRDKLVR